MSSNLLLNDLNEHQSIAVSAKPGNMLVLAGAGSGKTKVLVHRIAWLIHQENYSPYSILAVTFTNKAAGEIRGRIESLLRMSTAGMWVGTFHSIAHRLLRAHYLEAGLEQNFQILDSEDQKRLIKRAIQSLNLDDNTWAPKEAQWFINNKKDKGIRPEKIATNADFHTQTMANIYNAYEGLCRQSNLIDFAEILLRAYELLLKNPETLQHYQTRFKSILVDEFQDTNTIQYRWLKLLAHEQNHMVIVGDDDQSIYGWRGAKIENIKKFSKDFPNASTIRLEQNYRSTGAILNAANNLICHNGERLGKKLWSAGATGSPIALYSAFNEIDEAKFVADQVLEWVSKGYSRSDMAVLYRSNMQSRVIEEQLLQAGITYRVYGGMRFFERAEIKDALGYLRLIANQHDDAAFERVVNQPNRGIGDRTLSIIRQAAKENFCSLWNAAVSSIQQNILTPRAKNSLAGFINMIQQMQQYSVEIELYEITERMFQCTGLVEFYSLQKGEKARSKVENLEELVSATKNYSIEEDTEATVLQSFLSHASLEAGETQGSEQQDCVQLMTLHSAKGLEFPIVFMVGVEEGVFPHQMSADEPGRLEEERRLCYVGMTRAMEQLYLTYSELRRQYGREQYHRVSRFVQEMGNDSLVEIRKKIRVQRPISSQNKKFPSNFNHESGLKLGQNVRHKKFGEGTLLNLEGSGSNTRVEINFKDFGIKRLVLSYANLEGFS